MNIISFTPKELVNQAIKADAARQSLRVKFVQLLQREAENPENSFEFLLSLYSDIVEEGVERLPQFELLRLTSCLNQVLRKEAERRGLSFEGIKFE